MNVKRILVATLAVLFISFVAIQFSDVKAATTRNFTLYGSYVEGGWSFTSTINDTTKNPTIVVEQGDTVNLTLISADENTHRFFVSYTNSSSPQSGDPQSPDFSGTINFNFTATPTVGTYTYYCYYHYTTMHGYFQVVPTGTIPEFQPLTILASLAAITVVACFVYRKKRQT